LKRQSSPRDGSRWRSPFIPDQENPDMSSFFTRSAAIAGCILGTTGLSTHAFAQAPMLDHVMLVVGKNEAGIYDVGSGREISRIAMTGASLDTMALTNGVALFNNTGGNQVIAVNLKDGKEIARIPASSLGGTRPVHSYLSPVMGGRQFYVVLNDGVEANTPAGEAPKDSSLTLIDVVPGSATYLKPVGEVRLGRGHHKVAFSNTRARMVVSTMKLERPASGSARTALAHRLPLAKPITLSPAPAK